MRSTCVRQAGFGAGIEISAHSLQVPRRRSNVWRDTYPCYAAQQHVFPTV